MRASPWLSAALSLTTFLTLAYRNPSDSFAQPASSKPNWIWTEDATLQNAPDGTRYFRKIFKLDFTPASANLQITADNTYRVWVNGTEVGTGNDWNQFTSYPVGKLLKPGDNVIAVEAGNEGASPAGLLVELRAKSKERSLSVICDNSWKTSKEVPKGWEKIGFDDAKWGKAKVLAALGEGPWGNLGAAGPAPAKAGTFTVPEGFKVEKVVPATVELIDGTKAPIPHYRLSLVNMCLDAKGRIFVSQENGPVLLCTDPNKAGEFQKASVFCDQVKNCQGMSWIHDSLYLIGNGPKGTGLYRGLVSNAGDRIEKVEILARFDGGMGEHGPHAVIHGPDDKLYIVVGNHAHLILDKLAANSPLTRWSTGRQSPDHGEPGSKEDVLLKRQNDANGHAAGLRAPGGTIWRLDLDGKNPALIAAGFRNEFDAAFNTDGELFTFDSDMEWDENLPWYRPVRVCHIIPGAEFGWRTGSSKIPPYAEDTLPAVVDTGRGSPTGVTFYTGHAYPAKYRGAFFMCDWSIGVLWAVHLNRSGASYKAEAEKFCSGSPMPISDCVEGTDGALYFTLGGRGTQGGVYRIVSTAPTTETKDSIKPREVTRAMRIQRLGYEPGKKDAEKELVEALKDPDLLVRRLACESMIRLGIEPKVDDLRPLLTSDDHFLRTAARLVLQRIDPKNWAAELINAEDDRLAQEGIIALCKVDKAKEYADSIYARLAKPHSAQTVESMLAWLRTVELALIYAPKSSGSVERIAEECLKLFPQENAMVNRQLAILLAEFARSGVLKNGVIPKILAAMKDPKSDRQQQIHYYYCLRVIKNGWTPQEKAALLAWYDGTQGWSGGASFSRYLENILREMNDIFSSEDRTGVLTQAEKHPLSGLLMLRLASVEQLPAPKKLGELFAIMLRKNPPPKANEWKEAIIEALGKEGTANAQAELRAIADADPSQRTAIGKALVKSPTAENLPYLIRAMAGGNAGNSIDLVNGLLANSGKPKLDDGPAFRSLLLAAKKIDEKQRWKIVQVLRHWTGDKQFGAKEGDWKTELASWGKWFNQSFPMQEKLPDLADDQPAPSKYKYDELLAFLTTDPKGKKGDPVKGKLAFVKAQCMKCHRYGTESEGLGPDLTAVSKRFKRSEILESILYPSKVISDQYRSTKVNLLDGKSYNGLLAPQAGTVTMLLQDGSKVVFKESDIEQRIASLISVMPEKLMDELSKEEIADLFSFLETEPKK